jgi:RNA recognition motif-containing protein
LGRAHVFLGNVPYRAVEADLENLVAPVADVVRVRIVAQSGRTVAFVWLHDPTEADEAIAALDGVELFGRRLRAERAARRA